MFETEIKELFTYAINSHEIEVRAYRLTSEELARHVIRTYAIAFANKDWGRETLANKEIVSGLSEKLSEYFSK